MSTTQNISDLIAAAKAAGSDEAFVEQYPFPFLVREATGKSVPAVPTDRGTQRLKAAAVPTGDGFMEAEVSVYAVCPRDPENNEGAVTLGRDAGCDVVVADGSISTVHLRFTLEVEGDERVFFVADAGSSNGTFLNGERLEPDAPTRISDQDSLRVGPAVKLQFFTAEGFYEFLDFYRRIKKKPS